MLYQLIYTARYSCRTHVYDAKILYIPGITTINQPLIPSLQTHYSAKHLYYHPLNVYLNSPKHAQKGNITPKTRKKNKSKSIPNFYASKLYIHKSIPNSVSPKVSPTHFLTSQYIINCHYRFIHLPSSTSPIKRFLKHLKHFIFLSQILLYNYYLEYLCNDNF